MLKFIKFQLFITLFLCLSATIFAQTQTAESFFEQGMKLVREEKYEQALEAFRQSVKINPKLHEAHANIGSVLMVLKRPAESAKSFGEAVKLAPTNAGYRASFCQSLFFAGQKTEALPQCEEAVRLDENSPLARFGLLTVMMNVGKSDGDILTRLESALEKFPENEQILNLAAEFYLENENLSQALFYSEKLAQIDPKDVFYQVRLANIYLRLERDSDAIAAANKALELDPKEPMAHYFLGRVYFELGLYEEATAAFQKTIEFNTNFSDVFYYLGISEKRRGKSENAIAALRKAIVLKPDNFTYQMELGDIFSEAGKNNEAVAVYQKAVTLKPKDFMAKVGLGLSLSETGNYEEALPYLMEADKMRPGNDIVQMFLNVTRARQQGVAQIPQMKQYAKENPQDINIRVRLVQLLGYSGRMSETAPYIEEIWKLQPKDVRVHQTIGVVYITAGNFEKALEVYQKAAAIEENPGTYMGLADIYTRSGKIEEAINAYKKVIELKPDSPNIIKIYADLLRDNNKKREALEMYKRSLSILPLNPPALFDAAVLSIRFGDKDSARQYLATLKSLDPQLARSLERFLRLKN